jgi:hypothetical protein
LLVLVIDLQICFLEIIVPLQECIVWVICGTIGADLLTLPWSSRGTYPVVLSTIEKWPPVVSFLPCKSLATI